MTNKVLTLEQHKQLGRSIDNALDIIIQSSAMLTGTFGQNRISEKLTEALEHIEIVRTVLEKAAETEGHNHHEIRGYYCDKSKP